MRRPRPGVGSELLPVALILIGLAGTFGLVVSMHRKAAATRPLDRPPSAPPVVQTPAPSPEPAEPEEPPPPPPQVVSQPPLPPAEDPTEKAVGGLNAQEADQRRAAAEADRKADALGRARESALAESRRLRRREVLVRGQVDGLDDKARALELESDSLAMERDALARELDATKAAVVKARARNGGYAVMPNKAANGTWQRPVMIECRDGQAVLQPKGLAFSMMDLSGGFSARSSPIVLAVGRELIRAHRATSPDGSSVIPYIYFVIRPDGVRPYYEARSRLEPLGIAFGYELVEQDWEIEFPDFDDLDSWDGSSATRHPEDSGRPAGRGPDPRNGNGGGRGRTPVGFAGTGNGPAQVAGAYGFVWPTGRPVDGPQPGGQTGEVPGTGAESGRTEPGSSGHGSGNASSGAAEGSGFVWPADRPGGVRGGNGLWPTRPPGDEGDGQGGTGEPGGRSGTGGGEAGAKGSVPPLEFVDADSLAREGIGAPGEGLDFSGLANPGRPVLSPAGPGSGRGQAVDPAGDRPSLVRVNPGGLPGLDRPVPSGEASRSGDGTGVATPGRAVSQSTGPGFDPSGLAGSPADPLGSIPPPVRGPGRVADRIVGGDKPAASGEATGGKDGTGGASGKLPSAAPPPGWVRIDPSMLASAAGNGPDDPEKLPALPSRAKLGDGTREAVASGGAAGPSNGSAASQPPQPNGGPGIPSLGGGPQNRSGDYRPKPSSAPAWSPRMTQTISVPLDLVVACGPDGVVIHPGGYRLSRAALGKNGALRRDLQTIVRNHEMIDAGVRPLPRIQFLIEAGGGETYTEARRQTVLDGLPWPVSMRVAGAQSPGVFPKERF